MRIRPEVAAITPYQPGRPISEVARELGFEPSELIKLASNESPYPPFPEVVEAIINASSGINRYPDNAGYQLTADLAARWEVEPGQVWVGAGSSELLRVIALAVGGPGTSACFGRPSFVIYRLASQLSGAERIEVALDSHHRYDLEAMVMAVRPDTTVFYICNPNNPTGTYRSGADIRAAIEVLPEEVLVVVDEAYAEFADASDYQSAVGWLEEFPNLVVARTFSKIYGLASLRVGYALGSEEALNQIRKAQAPFTVSSLGQVAAIEALRHPDQVTTRFEANRQGREQIESGLAELGIEFIPSQANFIAFRLGNSTKKTVSALLAKKLIIRSVSGGWVRTTVGTEEENRKLLSALAEVTAD